MPSCSAANCKSKHEHGVRLFRWPSAPDRARLWLERCSRADSGWQPKPSSRLCEKHFDPGQFEEHRQDGWRKLKPNAVPTIFSNEADGCTVQRSKTAKSQTGLRSDSQKARLVTDVKKSKELPQNVLLDLQVSEELAVDVNDAEPDNLSDADHSCHVTAEKGSDSKQEINRTNHASNTTQKTDSSITDPDHHEHTYTQHLLKQTVYQCPLCARLTMSLELLMKHLAKHKLRNGMDVRCGQHRCTMCGKQFAHAAVLASHARIVHPGKKAGSSAGEKSSAEVGRQRFLCAVCGRQFVQAGAFHRHSRSHVPAPVGGDGCYLCSVCGCRAGTAAALYRHSAVHVAPDRRPLACAHCDRRFVRAGDLRKHVRVHTGERPYRCSVCGRAFARTYSLLAHGRTHAARSSLRPCVGCRRTFRSDAGLAVHRSFCVRLLRYQGCS